MRKLLVGVYPRAWRVRYGDELLALLQQLPLTPATVLNLLGGAAAAHWQQRDAWAAAVRYASRGRVLWWVASSFATAGVAMCFARLVTHYWRHSGFLEDGILLRDADRLSGIPGVLVHGRLDVSSPLDVPWQLSQAWPSSKLVMDDAGHSVGHPGMTEALVEATDRFGEASAPHTT